MKISSFKVSSTCFKNKSSLQINAWKVTMLLNMHSLKFESIKQRLCVDVTSCFLKKFKLKEKKSFVKIHISAIRHRHWQENNHEKMIMSWTNHATKTYLKINSHRNVFTCDRSNDAIDLNKLFQYRVSWRDQRWTRSVNAILLIKQLIRTIMSNDQVSNKSYSEKIFDDQSYVECNLLMIQSIRKQFITFASRFHVTNFVLFIV